MKPTIRHLLLMLLAFQLGSAEAIDAYQAAFDVRALDDPRDTLGQPHRVAVDGQDRILVTDLLNGRVVVYDAQGRFLFSFGESGTGNGQFVAPVGIDVDSEGNIYVGDRPSDRIQKFDASGNFLVSWGSSGSGDGQFEAPEDIAVGPGDTIYVADRDNARVQAFDRDGNFLRAWGERGTGPGQLNFPSGLYVEPGGNVLVADPRNHRISRFSPTGQFIASFGVQGPGSGELLLPYDVTMNELGELVVSEVGNDRLQIFDTDGNSVALVGSKGAALGEFDIPRGLAVDSSGHLLVADDVNDRVQALIRGPRLEVGNPDAGADDRYGQALASSGGLLVVGAPGRNGAGEVDLFRREGNTMVRFQTLAVPSGFSAAGFGKALDLQGDLLAVGAPDEPQAAPKGSTPLRAAIFERLQAGWTFKFGLASASQSPGDGFGAAVALDGDQVAVGAPNDDGGQGAVYVFRLGNLGATQTERLLPPPSGKGQISRFGSSLAFKNGRLAAGSPATGLNLAGSVALFDIIAGNLQSPPTVVTGAGEPGDNFGNSISIAGDTMLVGAPGQDDGMGSAFVFPLAGDRVTRFPVMPPNRQPGARFGASVALSFGRAIVGAPGATFFSKGLSTGANFTFSIGEASATGTNSDLPPESGTCGKGAKGCGIPGVEGYGETSALTEETGVTGAPRAYGGEGSVFVSLDVITQFDDGFEGAGSPLQ